jgi:threonine aldolase
VKADDPHFARTRLLALENTITGRVLARPYLEKAIQLAERKGLATHLDGGMRQAGIIAAAGLYALEHNVERLQTDDENALRLAKGLTELGLQSDSKTNMVLAAIPREKLAGLVAYLKAQQVLVLGRTPMRLVTHLDVDAAGIERALAAFRSYFR